MVIVTYFTLLFLFTSCLTFLFTSIISNYYILSIIWHLLVIFDFLNHFIIYCIGSTITFLELLSLELFRLTFHLFQVKVVNSTELLDILSLSKSQKSSACVLVMFYAPWCHFCAQTSPHYNALARAFPQLDILAVDTSHFS